MEAQTYAYIFYGLIWCLYLLIVLQFVAEMPVPIAIIVCEGDTETISHIAEALKKNLPIIIMKGSGKAADLVLDYLETYTCINDFGIVKIRACVIF